VPAKGFNFDGASRPQPSPAEGLLFWHPNRGPGPKGTKKPKYDFLGLSLQNAIPVLLENSSPIRGHLDVLTAGLCAWVLRPTKSSYAAHHMLVAAAVEIDRSARERPHLYGRGSALGLSRGFRSYVGDFDELFCRMGGLRRLIDTYRAREDRETLHKKDQRELEYLNLLIAFLHADATNPSGMRNIPLSIEQANEIAENLKLLPVHENTSKEKITRLSIKQIRNYWAPHEPSLALAYTATEIMYSDELTLLQAISRRSFSYSTVRAVMPEWFAKSEFVRESVLEKSRFGKAETRGVMMYVELPDQKPMTFSPTRFSNDQLTQIQNWRSGNSAAQPAPIATNDAR
jgi:hypothetical protein